VTRYLTAPEFFWLAEQVTATPAELLAEASRLDLATAALHAPAAAFEDDEFYPDLHDKAAVLACRLARSRALPGGNLRAAWAALATFVELNGGRWIPDRPDAEEAQREMAAVATRAVDEDAMSDWLRVRVAFASH
jgi:death-on-curing protein